MPAQQTPITLEGFIARELGIYNRPWAKCYEARVTALRDNFDDALLRCLWHHTRGDITKISTLLKISYNAAHKRCQRLPQIYGNADE